MMKNPFTSSSGSDSISCREGGEFPRCIAGEERDDTMESRGGYSEAWGGWVKQIQGIKMEQHKQQKIWENNYEINRRSTSKETTEQRNDRAKQRKRQRRNHINSCDRSTHTHTPP